VNLIEGTPRSERRCQRTTPTPRKLSLSNYWLSLHELLFRRQNDTRVPSHIRGR
jgi:hypothetical protein